MAKIKSPTGQREKAPVEKKTSSGSSKRTKLSATSASWPNKAKKRYRGQGR
jgi:hypothetical protein